MLIISRLLIILILLHDGLFDGSIVVAGETEHATRLVYMLLLLGVVVNRLLGLLLTAFLFGILLAFRVVVLLLLINNFNIVVHLLLDLLDIIRLLL